MFGRGPIGEEFQAIELFADYASVSGVTRARLQIGIAIAPDPDAPLGFHFPDSASQVPTEWRDHCLLDRFTLAARHDALSLLPAIVVGVADADRQTNHAVNIRMLTALRQVDIKALLLQMPGTHGGDRPRRFIRLATAVTRSMNTGFPDPAITAPDAWGRIKEGASW
jgi:hypothetical protein